MKNKSISWNPDIVARMTTEAIDTKMKELVPGFNIDEFPALSEKYISTEDMAEEEFYPKAVFYGADEDFIWIACNELWNRLVQDRLSIEAVADQFNDLIDASIAAEDMKRYTEVIDLNHKALDLVWRHLIEMVDGKPVLKLDFYDKFNYALSSNLDDELANLIRSLIGNQEYDKVIDIAGTLAELLKDNYYLRFKAESFFGLGRQNEGEKLFIEIIAHNPAEPWMAIFAGDCFAVYNPVDLSKTREYFIKALAMAKNLPMTPDNIEILKAIYIKLIDLAYKMGDNETAEHYLDILIPPKPKKVGRNDPCPCGSGKKYKKCCGLEPVEVLDPPVSRQLMERDLRGLVQHLRSMNFQSADELYEYMDTLNKFDTRLEWAPDTKLEQAQNLVYKALEATGKRRLKFIEEALEISPDCADAWVLLAQEKAQSLEEELDYYEAGVKAGERALGDKAFKALAGSFWGVLETRPYIRARAGMAQTLWQLGKHEEAVSNFFEILRLNPNDNLGIRYLLLAALLTMKRYPDLERLLGEYDEPSAHWLYTEALLAYIKQGGTTKANRLLKKAIAQNPHVVDYLLGRKKFPAEEPDSIGFGDTSEAIAYVFHFNPGWHLIKGATEWLVSVSGKSIGKWYTDAKTNDIPEIFTKTFEPDGNQTF